MKKLYSLEIRGKHKEWGFNTWEHPEHVELYREDGLVFNEVLNTYPNWVMYLGLADIWGKLQDWGFIPL